MVRILLVAEETMSLQESLLKIGKKKREAMPVIGS
jgi:hypothetical protein